MNLRNIFMLMGIVGLLSGCDTPEGDYVKTVKGDTVRKQDAEAASVPVRSDSAGEDERDDNTDR